jgi:hypothetical protein
MMIKKSVELPVTSGLPVYIVSSSPNSFLDTRSTPVYFVSKAYPGAKPVRVVSPTYPGAEPVRVVSPTSLGARPVYKVDGISA